MALICPFWTNHVKTVEVCPEADSAVAWLSGETTEVTFPGMDRYIEVGSSAWADETNWSGPGPFVEGQKEAWMTVATLIGEGVSVPHFSIEAGAGASITQWKIVGGASDGDGGYFLADVVHPGLGVGIKQWTTVGTNTLFSFYATHTVPGESSIWRTRTFQIQPTVGGNAGNTLTVHVKHTQLFV